MSNTSQNVLSAVTNNVNNSTTPVAEVQLIYKNELLVSERITITRSEEVYNVFLAEWDKDTIDLHEEVALLLLNQANHVLGIYRMSKGGVTSSMLDPRLVFIAALKLNAVQICVAINHPSGNLTASKSEFQMFKTIKEAGVLLQIKLVDFVIISREGYYSFADDGEL